MFPNKNHPAMGVPPWPWQPLDRRPPGTGSAQVVVERLASAVPRPGKCTAQRRNEPKQFRRNKRGRWGSETTTHMVKNDVSTIVVRINDGLLMVY